MNQFIDVDTSLDGILHTSWTASTQSLSPSSFSHFPLSDIIQLALVVVPCLIFFVGVMYVRVAKNRFSALAHSISNEIGTVSRELHADVIEEAVSYSICDDDCVSTTDDMYMSLPSSPQRPNDDAKIKSRRHPLVPHLKLSQITETIDNKPCFIKAQRSSPIPQDSARISCFHDKSINGEILLEQLQLLEINEVPSSGPRSGNYCLQLSQLEGGITPPSHCDDSIHKNTIFTKLMNNCLIRQVSFIFNHITKTHTMSKFFTRKVM